MIAQETAERHGNTQSAHRTSVPQEVEDKIMQVLPRPLADWIRYEAHTDYCVKDLFLEWRRGVPVESLLTSLRSIGRQETRRTYGHRHPHVSVN